MSGESPTRFFLNKNAGAIDSKAASPLSGPREFHQRLPGYAPTPLIDARELAATLEVGQLLIKDESRRLGLPAFKILILRQANSIERRKPEIYLGRSEKLAACLNRVAPALFRRLLAKMRLK